MATYQTMANSEYQDRLCGRHTAGANVRREKGNNPDPQLRSPITAKWKTMWKGTASQAVGLEATILYRTSNSSLVASISAEDSKGISGKLKLEVPTSVGAATE